MSEVLNHTYFSSSLSRELLKETRENAHLLVRVDRSCQPHPSSRVGGNWCLTPGKLLSSHALLLTAHSTQAASWVGGNSNSSNGKHLLTPRTDCIHSGNTCWSQIKPAGVTEPVLNHVPCSSFQKAAIAHSKEAPCTLLASLSGGAGQKDMPDRGAPRI